MRVLFDQGTPVPIRLYLKGHLVSTSAKLNLNRLADGPLLSEAEKLGFNVLLTTDKNLRHQQNLKTRRIAIVVLGRQQWPVLRNHVQLVVRAVNAAVPGSYTEVQIPG